MINLLKHSSDSKKISFEGLNLLRVMHAYELRNQELEYINAIIIDTEDEQHAKDILYQIIVVEEIKIGFMPIFINNIYALSKNILIHTDGYIDINMLSSYAQRIRIINKRIDKLNVSSLKSHKELVTYKLLGYCFTRNKTVTPITSRNNLIGYLFPYISLLYKNSEMMVMLKLLDKLVYNKLISFKLHDYIHVCKSCNSNYINFRECCPKCDSIDIEAHDMVHHFVCAHVAPEKDFKTENGLECPKCDKQLRHIGIDYDKPSTIYSCNSCMHEFQNTGMKALCIDCNTEQQLDELIEKRIGNYSLTQKGENHVIGNYKEQDVKKSVARGSMSFPLYKILLRQEIQRVKVTNCNSFFVKVSFNNPQLEILNTDVKKELMHEIGGIIKSYLMEADILCAKKFNCYYLLLPETKEDQLERLENIQYNLAKLISDNLEDTQQNIEIFYKQIMDNTLVQNYFE